MSRAGVPSRRSLLVLLRVLWQITTGGLRVFFWDGLKTGLIDVRPLTRVVRLLTVSGLLLVFAYLASILFNDVLRTQGVLEPLLFESSSNRGLLVPDVVIPLTLITMTLAWSYVLTGALHVRRRMRWLVFALYVVFGFLGLADAALSIPSQAGQFSPSVITAAFLAVLALLWIAFLMLPHRRLSIGVEFTLILGLQTSLSLLALAQAVHAQQQTGFVYVGSYLVTTMIDLSRLAIVPFLINSGSEMGNFARDVAGWAVKAVHRYAAAGVTRLLLLGFLGYRWLDLLRHLAGGGLPAQQVNAWIGALLLVAGLGAIQMWWRRQQGGTDVPVRVVLGLIVAPQLVQISLGPIVTIVSSAFAFTASFNMAGGSVDYAGVLGQANQAMGYLAAVSKAYGDHAGLVIAALGAIVAWQAARRGQATIAAFGMALGWGQLLGWLIEPGRALRPLAYQYTDVDVVLLAVMTGVTAFWLARDRHLRWNEEAAGRMLTHDRALRLLALAFLAALLAQTGFLNDPFSPFFSFAGVFFLVFGILWGVLTAGGKFANEDSTDYPRASRLLLYIGYALLSLAIAHWFIVSHNAENQAIQSRLTLTGFQTYGLALAYLVFIEGGRRLMEE